MSSSGVTIKFRRGTAAQWTSANPVLAAGEPAYETDTGKTKIGDGTTAWASLAYKPATTDLPASVDTSRVAAQAGDTGASIGLGSFVPSPAWGAGHTFRDSNKDGIFYIQNFTDAAGSDSGPTTFNNVFGVRITKTGAGSLNPHWASVIHKGSGQAGLFIGDVTADASGSAGDIWGGDFVCIFNIAANSTGLRILMTPNVAVNGVGGKTQQALEVANSVNANAITQGIRILGNFVNPIIHYSDAAGTTTTFFTDMSGNLTMAGNLLPKTGSSKTLGTIGFKWQQLFLSTYLSINGGVSAGASGALGIADAAQAPSGTPSTSGFVLYSTAGLPKIMDGAGNFRSLGLLALYGDGSDGTGTFDGSATPAGTSKSGSTYTLTRDVFYTNATLSNNAIIHTASFKLFCTQTLTIGSGSTISNDGNAGSGATQGGGVGSKTLGGSSAGGAGAVGTTGSVGGNPSSSLGMGAAGGAGGAATGGGTGGGQTGGSPTLTAATGSPRNLIQALNLLSASTGAQLVSAGGGGGGNAPANSTSGGGGSGGGIVAIYAQFIANAGTISAQGGVGGAAAIGTGTGAGGGGGGGGGVIVLVYSSLSGAGSTTVAGGAGGALAGTGAAGANGGTGTVYSVVA